MPQNTQENKTNSKFKNFLLKNRSSWLAITIAIIALLFVGGLILFNIFKPKEEMKNTSVNVVNQTSTDSQTSSTVAPIPKNNTNSGNQQNPTTPAAPVVNNLPVKVN